MSFAIPARAALAVIAAAMLCLAADAAPEFDAQGLVQGTRPASILPPGAVHMTIFGRNLGPPSCIGKADPALREPPNTHQPYPGLTDNLVYPFELCGVQVLIGDRPAGLLYVSPTQINFKVPLDTPETASAALRVVYNGQSSAPFSIPVGFERVTVALEQPAYVGMPVWLKLNLPHPRSVEYPAFGAPLDFGCEAVEVRLNGRALPRIPTPGPRLSFPGSGPGCGNLAPAGKPRHPDSLPLHLMYRFDQPGTYEVRATSSTVLGPLRASSPSDQSEWTPIQILPAQPGQREAWIAGVRAHPPSDSLELLTGTLPDLMGFPDQASFEVLTGYLYHSDELVRRFAAQGLAYWPLDSVLPAVFDLARAKGATDVVSSLLAHPAFRAAYRAETDQIWIADLNSDSPPLIEGALTMLRTTMLNSPQLPEPLLLSDQHVMARVSHQYQVYFAEIVAGTKDPRARGLLWKLYDQGYAPEMSSALGSLKNPEDLPKLAAPLTQTTPESWVMTLPAELYRLYGSAAVPYLEAALRGSAERPLARSLAQTLMIANSRAGFAYAANAIDQGGATRQEMLRMVKGEFPDLLRARDDASVTAFVKERAR